MIATLVAIGLAKVAIGSCDSKFGCVGGLQVALLLGAVAGLLSAVGYCIALAAGVALKIDAPPHQIPLASVAGVALAIALPFYIRHAPFDSVALMLLGWVVLSALVVGVCSVVSKVLPNNSLERSRER